MQKEAWAVLGFVPGIFSRVFITSNVTLDCAWYEGFHLRILRGTVICCLVNVWFARVRRKCRVSFKPEPWPSHLHECSYTLPSHLDASPQQECPEVSR